MAVTKINLAWITVSDLKKAKNFFVNILGFKVNEEHAEFGWMELQGSQGGMLLGLAEACGSCSSEKPGSNAIMTFNVNNIEASKKEFEAKGVTFHGPVVEVPGQVKLVFFTDVDGNKFQLVEEINKK